MNIHELRTELLRRAKIASDLFDWSDAHLTGFARGLDEALQLGDKTTISLDSKDYGFRVERIYGPDMETTTLSNAMLEKLGRYDAFQAVRSWHKEIKEPSQESMLAQAKFWYLSSECDFDIDETACEFCPDFPLSEMLRSRPASSWIEVLKVDHQARLNEGTEGYADLVLQKHLQPYFIADRGEGRAPGIFDGYHRIGAALAVGSKTCTAIYAFRSPEYEQELNRAYGM